MPTKCVLISWFFSDVLNKICFHSTFMMHKKIHNRSRSRVTHGLRLKVPPGPLKLPPQHRRRHKEPIGVLQVIGTVKQLLRKRRNGRPKADTLQIWIHMNKRPALNKLVGRLCVGKMETIGKLCVVRTLRDHNNLQHFENFKRRRVRKLTLVFKPCKTVLVFVNS